MDSNPFVGGDSSKSKNLLKVGDELQDLADGKKPFTLILGQYFVVCWLSNNVF